MANEYVADPAYSQEDFSAGSVLDEAKNESAIDKQRLEEAETANVKDARFIGYAEVLAAYEARTDTEHLADRRARENAVTADEQDFTRHADYDGNSGTEKDQGTDAPVPEEPVDPEGG